MTYLSLRCFSDCSKDAADGREWRKVGLRRTYGFSDCPKDAADGREWLKVAVRRVRRHMMC